jgi:hypothetical protein
MSQSRQWTRNDAELRIKELLDDAKTDGPQKIMDDGGRFEVQYVAGKLKQTTGERLAKGGPVEN